MRLAAVVPPSSSGLLQRSPTPVMRWLAGRTHCQPTTSAHCEPAGLSRWQAHQPLRCLGESVAGIPHRPLHQPSPALQPHINLQPYPQPLTASPAASASASELAIDVQTHLESQLRARQCCSGQLLVSPDRSLFSQRDALSTLSIPSGTACSSLTAQSFLIPVSSRGKEQ